MDHALVALRQVLLREWRREVRDLAAREPRADDGLRSLEPVERSLVGVSLRGGRTTVPGEERPRHAEEVALDPHRVRVDEDHVAGLDDAIRRLGPPGVRVRAGAHGARREVLAPGAEHGVGQGGEQIPLTHAGDQRRLERGEHVDDHRAVDLEQRDLLRRLDLARLLGRRGRVDERDAPGLEREEPRRPQPVDGHDVTGHAELPDRVHDLLRPGRGLGTLVVVELPGVHRTHVGGDAARSMHRVPVLEQDRVAPPPERPRTGRTCSSRRSAWRTRRSRTGCWAR